MRYDPKLSRYAIKYFFRDLESKKIYGPSEHFEYKIGKWYTIKGELEVCGNGFHFPNYNDIFENEDSNWYREFQLSLRDGVCNHDETRANTELVVYLIEFRGKLGLTCDEYDYNDFSDCDKIAAQSIKLIKELHIEKEEDIPFTVTKLNKKYRTIYHENWLKYIKITNNDDFENILGYLIK